MSNPNRIPAGVHEGGQYTFGKLGGLIYGGNWGIEPDKLHGDRKWVDRVPDFNPWGHLNDHNWGAMSQDLQSVGALMDKEGGELIRKIQGLKQAEKQRLIVGYTENRYHNLVTGPAEEAIRIACGKNPELLAQGGEMKVLANDNGSFQLAVTPTRNQSEYLDGIKSIAPGEAVVVNPSTGALRKGVYFVPTGKRGDSQSLGKTPLSQALADRMTDSEHQSGRDLGSTQYGGRLVVGATQGPNGETVTTTGVLCEANELEVAQGYAESFGTEVLSTTSPKGVVNPIATSLLGHASPEDQTVLHSTDFFVSGNNSGGIQFGKEEDTAGRGYSKRPTPEERAQARHIAQEDARLRSERTKESGYRPRSEEQKKRDLENAAVRRSREKEARRIILENAKKRPEDRKPPIKVRGGLLLPGELGYDAALKDAQQTSKDFSKDGTVKAPKTKNSYEYEDRQRRRQRKRAASKASNDRYKENVKRIHQAIDEGRDGVTWYPDGESDGKRRGKKCVSLEGDKDYERASRCRNARPLSESSPYKTYMAKRGKKN